MARKKLSNKDDKTTNRSCKKPDIVEIANVRYDAPFKEVFSQKDILIDLLNNIYYYDTDEKNGLRIRGVIGNIKGNASASNITSTDVYFDLKCTCIVAESDEDAQKLIKLFTLAEPKELDVSEFEQYKANAYCFDIEMQRAAQNAFIQRSLISRDVCQKDEYDRVNRIVEIGSDHNDRFRLGVLNTRILSFISFYLKDYRNTIVAQDEIFIHIIPSFATKAKMYRGNLLTDEKIRISTDKELITYVQLPAIKKHYAKISKSEEYTELDLWLQFFMGANEVKSSYPVDKNIYHTSRAIKNAIRTLHAYQASPDTREELRDAVRREEAYIESVNTKTVDAMKKGIQEGLKKGEKIGLEKGEKIGLKKGEKIGIEKGKVEGAQKEREKTIVSDLLDETDKESFEMRKQKLSQKKQYQGDAETLKFINNQNFEFYKSNNFDYDTIIAILNIERSTSSSLN